MTELEVFEKFLAEATPGAKNQTALAVYRRSERAAMKLSPEAAARRLDWLRRLRRAVSEGSLSPKNDHQRTARFDDLTQSQGGTRPGSNQIHKFMTTK